MRKGSTVILDDPFYAEQGVSWVSTQSSEILSVQQNILKFRRDQAQALALALALQATSKGLPSGSHPRFARNPKGGKAKQPR